MVLRHPLGGRQGIPETDGLFQLQAPGLTVRPEEGGLALLEQLAWGLSCALKGSERLQCPVTTQKAWRHWEARVSGFIGLPFLTLVRLLILGTLPGSRGLLCPLLGSRPDCPIHGQ